MANTITVKKSVSAGEINGFYDPRFERVAAEFERNFQERGEIGASICVTVAGETMVDLWGGSANPAANMPWEEDTLCMIWSATKGATALCAHMLAARGLLDLDAPVTRYWPEFGQAEKEFIPVKMLLNHQCGLPAFTEPVPPGGFFDWDWMVSALARQEPLWTPGSKQGYGGFTFGWLAGEVIRRVSGKSVGAFFREEVAQPLGLDFWIGLPEEYESRTATIFPADPPAPGEPVSPMTLAILTDQTSLQAMVLFNTGGYMLPGSDGVFGFNTRAAHAAEIPAAGGITNARGLAGMYLPLANGGNAKGVTFVSRENLVRMGAVSSSVSIDQAALVPIRFTLGYAKATDNRRVPGCTKEDSLILSEEAFGHPGFGGAIGFADPAAHLSFGYAMNRMGPGVGLNDRGQSLVDAAYLSLGYTTNAPGVWIKG